MSVHVVVEQMKLLYILLCYCGFLFFVLLDGVESKVYTRCGLAQELLSLGFSSSWVGNWVCLVESESGRNTEKQVAKANGGTALGLFQINSKQWCTFGKTGGKCNMKCEDLLNENIRDDSACAQKIQSEQGFKAWDGWRRSCYGRTYPSTIITTCI
ncbi:unnamed protein product [Phaedon cochleariae]|uniref:lysozyme n=1 Tax=Phaedon cochleariae TaxID=80249 RepID=A0A9P0DQ25_PHACE|nr:unnamed protein product [Phaedon cochleariae]